MFNLIQIINCNRASALLLVAALFCAPSYSYSKDSQTAKASNKIETLSQNTSSQQKKKLTVKGSIKDHEGEPLVGVSIREEGSSNGTITDMNGQFQITVDQGACILCSYVGFQEKRIFCTNDQDIDINLEIDRKFLEEVVVVGYGTQKKVNLTGAVEQVNNKTLKDRPIVNIASGLQGLVPNLNIETNAGPSNSIKKINIRGMTSFNRAEPLILVDNVEMSLNQINPADIESISVLKDASSAAIYGARAAYGVVLIPHVVDRRVKNLLCKFRLWAIGKNQVKNLNY